MESYRVDEQLISSHPPSTLSLLPYKTNITQTFLSNSRTSSQTLRSDKKRQIWSSQVMDEPFPRVAQIITSPLEKPLKTSLPKLMIRCASVRAQWISLYCHWLKLDWFLSSGVVLSNVQIYSQHSTSSKKTFIWEQFLLCVTDGKAVQFYFYVDLEHHDFRPVFLVNTTHMYCKRWTREHSSQMADFFTEDLRLGHWDRWLKLHTQALPPD